MSNRQMKWVHWSKSIVWVCQLTLWVAGATSLFAQDATTQSAGGTGGDAYTIGCGSAKAMVGVQGRYGGHGLLGTLVNMVQPICVSVDAGGKWIGDPSPASATAGVNQGTFVSLMCYSHQAVSGIGGRSGIYVDQLQIQCGWIGEYGRLGQGDWAQGAIGGTGGNFFGPLTCPGDKTGKGFTGKAHDWIDRIALVCNYPSVPPAAVEEMFLSANSVLGGNPVNGTVTLNATAPSGGTQVTLSRGTNIADVSKIPSDPFPTNPITVPSGSKTGSFIFNTIPVASSVNVILAPEPQVTQGPLRVLNISFTILPPSLTKLSLSTKTLPGGSVTGTVSLNGKAPLGGLSASLTSSVTATATVPPTVAVAQGQTSATFPVTVPFISNSGCSVISASGLFTPPGGNPVKQTILAVTKPANAAFSLLMPPVSSSSAASTVTFPTTLNSPRIVLLASSNPTLVSVPPSVTVPADAAAAGFAITVQSRPPSGLSCAVITATDPAGNKNSLIVSIDVSSIKRID